MGRTTSGAPVILLGLSRENVDRLMDDQPIRVNLAEITGHALPALWVALMGGETDEDIRKQLEDTSALPAVLRPDAGEDSQ
jgi:hypothetical protein